MMQAFRPFGTTHNRFQDDQPQIVTLPRGCAIRVANKNVDSWLYVRWCMAGEGLLASSEDSLSVAPGGVETFGCRGEDTVFSACYESGVTGVYAVTKGEGV